MPVIELHVIDGYTDDDKSRLCAVLTDAVRLVVPAPPDAVTVLIHEVAAAGYMRGRQHRTPAPALPDPTQAVRAFLAAMEAREIDRAREMLGAGFVMEFPGTGPLHRLEDLIDWAKDRYRFVTKTYEGFDALQSQGDAAIVYCRGTLSGEWPNGTAFDGIRFIDRFEVTGGLITKQDVWNDIAEMKDTK
ncbi:nuclear transport factor 2 family protein [Sulfitobacter albidus]|uniref:Nuclear transport factor 2 family protein n=1 Tax=Sulfitobacter albidus TaxID=2829501 RepID=A0A975PP02_9RHOB|nr:nuclear transport factor 2 family protein [Sulfitobacter albidus]QUJ78304.1 nuclear transport factor 2 family protein [Sulfitobacter albidus]